MTAVLQLVDATVDFGGVKALNGVNLEVRRGSACGLIGPNGSGKSTLLAAVSRLVDLTSGRMLKEGTDYTHAPHHIPARLGISRTFQTVRLLSEMTVLANVMLGAATQVAERSPVSSWLLFWRSLAEDRACRTRAMAALERVGMADRADAYPDNLPYGLQRRVEIARALASEPQILLLDEPAAGMNQHEREEIVTLLRALRDEGLTQVFVEHDLGMVSGLCDHTYVLNFGKVIAQGTPDEVSRDPDVRAAYIGNVAADAATEAPSLGPEATL